MDFRYGCDWTVQYLLNLEVCVLEWWNLREQLAGSSSAAEADAIGEQQTKRPRTPYHRGAELKPTHSGSSSSRSGRNREPVETDAMERSKRKRRKAAEGSVRRHQQTENFCLFQNDTFLNAVSGCLPLASLALHRRP